MSRLLDALRRLQHVPTASAATSPLITQPFDPEELGRYAAEAANPPAGKTPDPSRLVDAMQASLEYASKKLSPRRSQPKTNATPAASPVGAATLSPPVVEVTRLERPRRVPTTGERDLFALLADKERSAAFRDLLQAVRQDTRGAAAPVVAVVGVDEHDPTARVASVLATLMAEERDRRVLLVEANPTGKSISSIYGLSTAVGLTEALAGRAGERCAVAPTAHQRLDILPFGQANGIEAQLLPSALPSELAQRRAGYGAIVIDAGLLTSDWAQVASQSADAVYLLVRVGETAAAYATNSVYRFRAAGGKLTGCIAVQGKVL